MIAECCSATDSLRCPTVNAFHTAKFQGLSRTSRVKFKDFRGPDLFSRTFQAFKMRKTNPRLSRTRGNPATDDGLSNLPASRLFVISQRSFGYAELRPHYERFSRTTNHCVFMIGRCDVKDNQSHHEKRTHWLFVKNAHNV